MRIVLSGPPSVGKSTQGQALSSWLGVPHISSGGLIRRQAAAGDPVARRLLDIVADGSLAPSDAMVSLVLSRLELDDCVGGFVLDGFPRKVEEASALLVHLSDPLDAFVVLKAPASVLKARVEDRARQTSFLRADDDPEVFPRRIRVYEQETEIVRGVMGDYNVPTFEIDATMDAHSVQQSLRFCLSPHLEAAPEAAQMGLAI